MFGSNIQQRIDIGQRSDRMKYSREARNFANILISMYAKYNSSQQAFSLHVDDIPDFQQQEFASILLRNDDIYATEATNYDNPNFEKDMLPALIKLLASTDKDDEINFVNSWRNGVTNHLKFLMEEIINNQLEG